MNFKVFKDFDVNTFYFAYGLGITVEKLLRLEFIGALFFVGIYSLLTCLIKLLFKKKGVIQ